MGTVRLLLIVLGLLPMCRLAAAGSPDTSLQKEVEDYLDSVGSAEGGGNPMELRGEWKGGPTFTTADGSFTIGLVGRLMWDSFWIASDDFGPSVTEDGTFFRRARLGVKGTVYRNMYFTVEFDFAKGTDVVLTDVLMGLQKLGFLGSVQVGHFKEPFGLEVMTSANSLTFMERAAATEAFAPFRNAGIAAGNAVLDERLTWAIGLFRNTDDTGATREDGGYSLTLRVTALAWRDEERGALVHVGFGFSLRDADDESMQFRARPGLGTGGRLVDTMSIAADRVQLYNFELALVWRSFSAQAEFYLVDVDGPSGGPSPSFSGWYAQASWWVTGEARPYKASAGAFGGVKPRRNFHDAGGGPGAWEIAVRFDTLDLTDGGVLGGEQDNVTLGVNWHWNPNARMMVNVVFVDVTGVTPAGKLTILMTRFQFHF